MKLINKTNNTETIPLVISASRATDIPAFHTEWFLNSLKRGHLRKANPYNPSQLKTIHLNNLKAIVFWTKNPEPLMNRFSELLKDCRKYYVLYTLTDYGGSIRSF